MTHTTNIERRQFLKILGAGSVAVTASALGMSTALAQTSAGVRPYLKVISLERDPKAEAVADDLATLTLDDAVRAEGFQRTGFNPFALLG